MLMKKLLALLLALSCLFLTACNNNPADSTTGTGTDNSKNEGTVNELELKDTIVYNLNMGFIDIPSRIVYQAGKVYYYSKADGKAYVYCFDPLCEHNDGYCLANPTTAFNLNILFSSIIVFTSIQGLGRSLNSDCGTGCCSCGRLLRVP